jgi:hypothetical protein
MGIRTPDLLIANETLYQLSYDPIHRRPAPVIMCQRVSQASAKNAHGAAGVHDRILRSADFQSAVSPSCTRQSVRSYGTRRVVGYSADCKSAIQQDAILRYTPRNSVVRTGRGK